MPVVLPRHMEDLWLDRTIDDPAARASDLAPYPNDAMEAY